MLLDRRRGVTVMLALSALMLWPLVITAQMPRGATGAPSRAAADTVVVSPASPRAALQEFTRLANSKAWDEAARYLAVPTSDREDAAQLARRLKVVLDQRLAINPATLSPLAVGDTTDDDHLGERLGAIVDETGREIDVRLVKMPGNTPPHWVFSAGTVNAIDSWYANLGAPWLRDRLPPTFLREGPLHLFLWQWIGLALLLPLILIGSWLLGATLRRLLVRLAASTTTDWDDLLLANLRGPFRLWVGALLTGPVLGLLDLNARVALFIESASRGQVLLAFFWSLLRVIRLVQHRLENAAWDAGQGGQARTLVPLLGNFLRVAVVIVAVLVALSQFGYPVGTLLAGLGIGGIAVALAAQKTVEHLFGSISLAADRAFRVGDWVRAGTVEGTVERIGLRSTSIRTHERTVVRIPNGRLADERIETFGERDRMCLRTDLDLTYDTPVATIDAVRDAIEAALRSHPLLWQESVRVYVVAFTESAIRLHVLAWFETADWPEFLTIRHRMLLRIREIVTEQGSQVAFPSRTVYHVTGGSSDGAATGPTSGSLTTGPLTDS